MLKRFSLFLIIFIFLIGLPVFADSITLKSGQTVEGMILENTGEYVKVDVDGVSLTYYLDEIDKINGEAVKPAAESKTDASISEEQSVAPNSRPEQEEPSGENSSSFESTESSAADLEKNKDTSFRDNQSKDPVNSNKTFSDSKTAVAAATIGIAVILFVLFLAVLAYVYSSLCLYFIAKKTATTPEWLAWIPIANLFLMCKIGKLSYLWLLPLLLPFVVVPIIFIVLGFTSAIIHPQAPGTLPIILLPVQIISALLMAALFGFIWYRIALARNKPAWIGIAMGGTIILGLIPFVGFLGSLANLVLMGYLAFSE